MFVGVCIEVSEPHVEESEMFHKTYEKKYSEFDSN